tara:strand:+ start:8996 stop:10150 length:1155 start_codon:yes stop_codon:yes gene_type:complete
VITIFSVWKYVERSTIFATAHDTKADTIASRHYNMSNYAVPNIVTYLGGTVMPKTFLSVTVLLLLMFYLVGCGPNQTVKDLESRSAGLIVQVGELQLELEETREAASVIEAKLESRIKGLLVENEQVKEEAINLDDQLVEIGGEVRSLIDEREALQREFIAFKESSGRERNQEIAALEAKVIEVRDRETALEVELSLTKDRLAEAELSRVELSRREVVAVESDLGEMPDVEQANELKASLLRTLEERDTLLSQLNQLENRNESLSERLERTADELEAAQDLASDLTLKYETLLQETRELDEVGDDQQAQLQTIRQSLENAQNEVARLTGARGIYTVQPADSLSSIASFFYRNGNRWPDIANANRFLISDNPDLIYPGMVLVVPN